MPKLIQCLTRETLVDLIHRSACVKYGGDFGDEIIQEDIDISDEEIERIADYLIANGVTIQKKSKKVKQHKRKHKAITIETMFALETMGRKAHGG